ncbi:hypothetical protein GDO81_019692 [Engystomops pustulosus]|uniref:TIL domain-containing protein n=1 Tax=Engystomops pustulosus TaxID=76066 RepID=A0AAV6ZAB2_ENGPU|nr:hypothetical protein GDO81_019692 [Engystomops pustulosus]
MAQTLVVLLSSLSLFLLMVTAQDPKISCEKAEGKEYSKCKGHCQPTCDNFTPPCDKRCIEGCVCQKGFVADNTGKCVKQESCCTGGNTTYSDCGSDCGKFCKGPKDPIVDCFFPPDQKCFPGCYCLPGYTHEKLGSKRCVLPADCPKY